MDAPRCAGVIVDRLDVRAVRRAARDGADVVEARVDTFSERDESALKAAFGKIKKDETAGRVPLLLAIRSVREGGVARIPDGERLRLFDSLMPFADAVDIELSSGNILKDVINLAKGKGAKVIVSHHDFHKTPGTKRLRDIVKRARAYGADYVKVAAAVACREDTRRLAALLAEDGGLIVIGMGEAARASRIFFPMLGSLLTYGSMTKATAPGQMTVREIKREFKRFGI